MNRADFPILKEKVHGRDLVYLDNAATSQKPQQVIDAIVEAYSTWNSNIHRGVHHLSQVATQHHEEARKAVADFIGAKSSDEIVFTKGTTDAINALAFSIGELTADSQQPTAYIQEGDEIIVSGLEHHSNIVPWQMLCERKKAVLRHIPLKDDLSLNIEAFKGLLSDRTKLVSVAHVSNVLGTIQPIEEIIRLAHANLFVSTERRVFRIEKWTYRLWIAIFWYFPVTRCMRLRVSVCCTESGNGSISYRRMKVAVR